MKIYTKTGDQGETGLFGGGRVRKDNPRIEAYGTVDELNAVLGMVRALSSKTEIDAKIDNTLATIQNDLFAIGAELSTADAAARSKMTTIALPHVETLERAIDALEQGLTTLREFVLPGGSPPAATLHLARTVARRAERRVISLSGLPDESVSPIVVVYLNRLSDLLFVMARAVNASLGVADVAWQKDEYDGTS